MESLSKAGLKVIGGGAATGAGAYGIGRLFWKIITQGNNATYSL
ncbi:hypothetical protein P5663_00565 [Priestia flexa]|nr:hypothetical protein [Priestia flexa]WEZ08482.1 hypothetical protein P5663_00565 [Priestia flexa]